MITLQCLALLNLRILNFAVTLFSGIFQIFNQILLKSPQTFQFISAVDGKDIRSSNMEWKFPRQINLTLWPISCHCSFSLPHEYIRKTSEEPEGFCSFQVHRRKPRGMKWVKDFVQVTPFSLVVEYFMNIYFFLPNSELGNSHQRCYMKKSCS